MDSKPGSRCTGVSLCKRPAAVVLCTLAHCSPASSWTAPCASKWAGILARPQISTRAATSPVHTRRAHRPVECSLGPAVGYTAAGTLASLVGLSVIHIRQGALGHYEGESQQEILGVPPEQATVAKISSLNKAQFVQLFHASPPPKPEDLNGEYESHVLPMGVLHRAAWFITHWVWGPGRWEGKALYTGNEGSGRGYNVFTVRGIKGGHRVKGRVFEHLLGKGKYDRRTSLKLQYKGHNRWPWGGMQDEVRRVNDKLFIGLGSIKATGGHRNCAPFVMVGPPLAVFEPVQQSTAPSLLSPFPANEAVEGAPPIDGPRAHPHPHQAHNLTDEAQRSILEEANTRNAAACLGCAWLYAGEPEAIRAKMVHVDQYGYELECTLAGSGELRRHRVPFEETAQGAEGVREELRASWNAGLYCQRPKHLLIRGGLLAAFVFALVQSPAKTVVVMQAKQAVRQYIQSLGLMKGLQFLLVFATLQRKYGENAKAMMMSRLVFLNPNMRLATMAAAVFVLIHTIETLYTLVILWKDVGVRGAALASWTLFTAFLGWPMVVKARLLRASARGEHVEHNAGRGKPSILIGLADRVRRRP